MKILIHQNKGDIKKLQNFQYSRKKNHFILWYFVDIIELLTMEGIENIYF